MPRFYAAGVEIQLCTTSLEHSSTTNPDDLGIGRGKKELEDIEGRFANASHLPERVVKDGDDDGVVRFLGNVDKSPFFLVRTGHTNKSPQIGPKAAVPRPVFGQSSSLNTANGSCHQGEEALIITVDVSSQSMRPGHDGKPMDLKIDVFVNGDFLGYKLLHGKNQPKKIIFSGHRLYTTFERPMVLRRPDAAHRTALNYVQRQQACKARWQLINRSLFQEAALRGLDKRNRPLPITDYLTSLATYGFPTALSDDTSPPVDINMGIVDIVISLGHGKKRTGDDAYSYVPTRLVETLHHATIPVKKEVLDSFLNIDAYPTTPVDTASSEVPSAGSTSAQNQVSAVSPQDSIVGHDSQENASLKPVRIKLRLRRSKKEAEPQKPTTSHASAGSGPCTSSLSIPTTPASSRRKTPFQIMEESCAWPVPHLSEGSVVSFATMDPSHERRAGETGIAPGMCRQVRKERSGEFTEEDVLMGVRFVVG